DRNCQGNRAILAYTAGPSVALAFPQPAANAEQTEETMRLGPLTFAIAAALLPAPLAAQEYPSRPVLFVVPYAPGGGTETMARLLGRRLEQRLRKPVVVDNTAGGGTPPGAPLF